MKLGEKIYYQYPEYKNMNTYFIVKGNNIKRFQSIQDNKIKNDNIIFLNAYK